MTTYFRRLVPGAAHSRYFIGDMADTGIFYVTRTQISRPDGQEIREPSRVTVLAHAPSTHTPLRKRVIDAADHRQNARNAARELAPAALPATKRCPCCKKERPANAFSTHVRHGKVRLQSWCKACMVSSAQAKRAIARAMQEAA